MKWKEIIIGAIATLVVTILGGIIIYYFTKEPTLPEPKESLIYQVEKPVTFQTDKTRLSLVTIRVGNFGELSSNNVTIGISFKEVQIVDKSVHFSTEPAATYSLNEPSESELNIKIPILAPGETAVITLLLSNEPNADPTIAVKSNKSLGENSEYFGKPFSFPEPTYIESIAQWLIPAAFIVQIILMIVYGRRILLRRMYKAPNNTAFLLLHNGVNEIAEKIIRTEIETRGGDSYLFSNYALCLALKGEYAPAVNFLCVADSAVVSNHDKAVVEFNRGITKLLQGNIPEGLSSFEKALQLSPRAISGYCKKSQVVEQLKVNVKEFANILALRVK